MSCENRSTAGRQIGAAAVISLYAGMAGANGLACTSAKDATTDSATMLCAAVTAALAASALPTDGLMVEVTAARSDFVAARLHRNGATGPLVQMVAMDGPLLADWPERMVADLLRSTPPP